METVIPLDKMTVAEKLRALEEIWNDLQKTAEEIPSPAWHEDVLKARAERVREGSSRFGDWTEAKRRILERTK